MEAETVREQTITAALRLLRQLGRSARAQTPHAGIAGSLGRLSELAALDCVPPSDGWVVTAALVPAIERASTSLGQISAGQGGEPGTWQSQALLDLVAQTPDPAWSRALASIFARAVPETRRVEPEPGAPEWQVIPTKRVLSAPRVAPRPPVRTWKPGNKLTVYIDETWDSEDNRTGVIAGVVVKGFAEDEGLHAAPSYGLAQISDQYWKTNPTRAEAALRAVLRSHIMMPFAFPVTVAEVHGDAPAQHDELLVRALQLLFAVIHRMHPTGENREVRIFADGYEPHEPGTDWTDYVRGRIDEVGSRIGRWRIDRFAWVHGTQGLVPYADLLANPLHPNGKGRMLRGAVTRLPGYVRFSLDLVPALIAVWDRDAPGLPEHIVDYLKLASGKLGESVLGQIREQVSASEELKRAVVRAIDDRFRAGDRDLAQLKCITHAWERVLPYDAPGISTGVELLARAIAIQKANHTGASERARPHIEAYVGGLRERALDAHREDVVFADLNHAVYRADRFEFDEALAITEAIVHDPMFASLGPRNRSRSLSSMGKYLSIHGRHAEADACFARALEAIDGADLTARERGGEIRRTLCYRAINALDGKLDGLGDRLREALGRSDRVVDELAGSDGGTAADYRHHILLRAVVLGEQPGWTPIADHYVARASKWKRGQVRHPWELIHLYRALLLSKRSHWAPTKRADTWFDAARAVVGGPHHGRTLRLTGVVIACVAACVHPVRYEPSAREALASMGEEWPEIAGRLDLIRTGVDQGGADGVMLALSALPFNYK